jgi:acetyl-CoA carboxylase biotin carboxyl carrier protein
MSRRCALGARYVMVLTDLPSASLVVGGSMAQELVAELVASVFKVVAEPGDVVEPGGTVVILESMKMEIPVLTEEGGTVREIPVREGDVVQEGDVLAVLE